MPLLPPFAALERFSPSDHPVPTRGERADQPAALHASALERSAPASALVDDVQSIMHLSPSAGRYLLHSVGPVSHLLPALVRPELHLDLRLALTRALDQNESTLTKSTIVAFEGRAAGGSSCRSRPFPRSPRRASGRSSSSSTAVGS